MAKVGVEAELFVGFHRVGAAVLQFVGTEFVEQSDAAAFLLFVDDEAALFSGDPFDGQFELRPAIAP
ncbi:hypothetical protein D3C83_163910 [compost metagenome]